MGLGDADLLDDGGGGKTAMCSICIEVVTDNGDRAWAKLQCGHQFHLGCIGSAFNVKGVMQCPNCRKIEKGQWLYANGCRPYPEFSVDDWAHDDDLYDLSYSESSMWCPYGGFTRHASAFDEGEFPTTAYHDLLAQHTIFTEHAAAVSSATQLCPYIAYIQPLHPSSSSSTSSASVDDGPTYNHQWTSQLASSEMPNSYALPTVDVHYHSLFPTSSSSVGGTNQPSMLSVMPRRAARTNTDVPRSGSYVHPSLISQGPVARAPSSVGSSMIHPYPGSAARARERSLALQAYFQQPSNLPVIHTPIVSGSRRSNSQPQVGQVGSASDQAHGGLYFLPTSGSTTARSFQAENTMSNPFHHTWERDPHSYSVVRDHVWGPFRQPGNASAASSRQRHSAMRTPSQSHYRS